MSSGAETGAALTRDKIKRKTAATNVAANRSHFLRDIRPILARDSPVDRCGESLYW